MLYLQYFSFYNTYSTTVKHSIVQKNNIYQIFQPTITFFLFFQCFYSCFQFSIFVVHLKVEKKKTFVQCPLMFLMKYFITFGTIIFFFFTFFPLLYIGTYYLLIGDWVISPLTVCNLINTRFFFFLFHLQQLLIKMHF